MFSGPYGSSNVTIRMPICRPGPAIALIIAASLAVPSAVGAQGLQDPAAVDRIVGSDVKEEEVDAGAEPDRVLAAIDKTTENIATVRMTSALDTVDIVFLADAVAAEGGPPAAIRDRIAQKSEEVEALRKEIEGNAMLYHAINARQILPRDVLAVDFTGEREIVIYAAAKPPAN